MVQLKTREESILAAAISILKMEKTCGNVSQILKALSHPGRLLVLGHLLNGPKAVGELTDLCGISQSQMSHFLMRMKIEGLVTVEREGKFRIYSVADKRLGRLLQTIQKEYCE